MYGYIKIITYPYLFDFAAHGKSIQVSVLSSVHLLTRLYDTDTALKNPCLASDNFANSEQEG
jgi:hypothetical protein